MYYSESVCVKNYYFTKMLSCSIFFPVNLLPKNPNNIFFYILPHLCVVLKIFILAGKTFFIYVWGKNILLLKDNNLFVTLIPDIHNKRYVLLQITFFLYIKICIPADISTTRLRSINKRRAVNTSVTGRPYTKVKRQQVD